MKKALFRIVACLGAAAIVLTTGAVANQDVAKVIPYPEVVNLKRVPIFNGKGMVPQQIVKKVVPEQIVKKVVPEQIVKKVVPQQMIASKPPKPYSHKKMSELLLEHQTLTGNAEGFKKVDR
jgi:hypothetical protein